MKNLQEFSISSVSAMGEISFDEAGYERLSNVLRNFRGNRRQGNIDKLGLYEVDGVRHHVGLDIEIVSRAKPRSARFMLAVHAFPTSERIRPSTRNKQMQQFSEIEEILSDIGKLDLNSQLHSHVDWRFRPDSKKPIIDLPMLSIQSPSFPFSEISGLRFRKITEGDLTTVTIDLMRDRSIFVTLVSPLTSRAISANMIDDIVQQSTQTIGDFVFDIDIPLGNGEEEL